MKSRLIIISVFYHLVIEVNLSDINKTYNHTVIKRQIKHDDDKWIWGFVDGGKKTPPTTNSPIKDKLKEEENPCKKVLPPMPDFRAPGKRISEQKCEEYLWALRNKLEENERLRDCQHYSHAHNLGFIAAAIGGRNALPGEFPHMGAIGWKAVTGTWIFKCGSFLISPKFVVTAAHCTKADARDTEIADVKPKVVRFGDKNIKDGLNNNFKAVTANIFKIIIHPDYKSPMKYNDIALMELGINLNFGKNVRPACLWQEFDTTPLGTKATATGWGVVKAAAKEISPILQVVNLDIIDSNTCDALLRPNCNRLWCGIEQTQICAGKLKGGVDACQGDSGGPLQVRIPLPSSEEGVMNYVIGVTSFGFGCALENTPGVYTRVSSYLDWIESYVWK